MPATMSWQRRIALTGAIGAGAFAFGVPVAAGVASPWGESELAAGALLGIVLGLSTLTVGRVTGCLRWRPVRHRAATVAVVVAAAATATVGGSPTAAIAEEALFRGLPIALALRWGSWRALFVVGAASAVTFTLVHPEPWSLNGANRLAFGVVCFIVAVRTSHVAWAAAVHMLSNSAWRLVPDGAAGPVVGHLVDLVILVAAVALVHVSARARHATADGSVIPPDPVDAPRGALVRVGVNPALGATSAGGRSFDPTEGGVP